jgi:hypothetical protein
MKSYFYKLIYKYLSIYIRPEDSLVEIDPENNFINEKYKNKTIINSKDLKYKESLKSLKETNPDFILLNGNIHYERDIQEFLFSIRSACNTNTRLVITYYSNLWKPMIVLSTWMGLRKKSIETNWISHEDIANLLLLTDYEVVRVENKILLPIYLPILSSFFNRIISPLPFFKHFNLVNILIARPIIKTDLNNPSVSIVVAARNEEGNIKNILDRIPKMGPNDELIFVEGNSTDNTWNKILELSKEYSSKLNIKTAQQEGKGKGDAVRKGFSLASKEILMILDADLTVPPEDLPRFYRAIKDGKGEFINGSRLVYPMEKEAMRFFNLLGNKFFALAFSYVLGQRFKDTLCGTKVISRENYKKLEKNRNYFGDFDPFGDFDLIFGAARMGLKIVEVPIIYRERTYGTTNISRWKHGVILLAMLIFAARKIKFI